MASAPPLPPSKRPSYTTRDWVVPERPKPGRKPKLKRPTAVVAITPAPSPPPTQPEPPAASGSGATAKAHQVAQLSGRILQLERDQGERFVFYQTQALHWKTEADSLRSRLSELEGDAAARARGAERGEGKGKTERENQVLKSHVETLRTEVDRLRRIITSLKSSSSASPQHPLLSMTHPTLVRGPSEDRRSASPFTVPDRDVKRRRTGSSPDTLSLSPGPDPGPVPIHLSTTTARPRALSSSSEMLLAAASASLGIPLSLPSAPATRCGTCDSDRSVCRCRTRSTATDSDSDSVPLRFARPAAPAERKVPVWYTVPAFPMTTTTSTTATIGGLRGRESRVREEDDAGEKQDCSGDPANCPACKDDPFGRAFCSALSANVCASNPCADCPNASSGESTSTVSAASVTTTTTAAPSSLPRPHHGTEVEAEEEDEMDPVDRFTEIPCCGHPELCGSQSCLPSQALPLSDPYPPPPASPLYTGPIEDLDGDSEREGGGRGERKEGEAMPCSDAWRQLKAHPNIGYANLQLLADVVSRRTRCDGPTPSPSSHPPPRPSPLRQEITQGPGHVKVEEVEHASSTALWASSSSSTASHDSYRPALQPSRLPSSPDHSMDGLVPHETLIAAYEGYQHQEQQGCPGKATVAGGGGGAGRRLTVERQAVREALQMLDRAVGKGI